MREKDSTEAKELPQKKSPKKSGKRKHDSDNSDNGESLSLAVRRPAFSCFRIHTTRARSGRYVRKTVVTLQKRVQLEPPNGV